MSKHNNNLASSSAKKCNCGRMITIGEEKSKGYVIGTYECPDCVDRKYLKPMSKDEYYKQFKF